MGHDEFDFTYQYMMLDRLRCDCEYFLGYGNRQEKHLWGTTVSGHIEAMIRTWNEIPEEFKPEWLNFDDILNYKSRMEGSDGQLS